MLLRQSLLAACLFSSLAYGRNITYSVILSAGNQYTVGVTVDDSTFALSPSPECPILFTGEAPEASKGYTYVKLKDNQVVEKESFVRQLAKDNTPNEFYNRTWNTVTVSKLPNVLSPLPSINRIQTDLHIDGQIPTLYFSGDQAEIDLMHKNSTGDNRVLTNMTYITPNKAQRLGGVRIELGGRGSRWSPKLAYNLKIEDKQELSGYRRLKLRSLVSDPSYLREQIVYDVLQSSGVATTGFSYARVFFNDRPMGLFGFIENYKNPWLKNEFAGGKKLDQGILYQGMSGSSTTGSRSDLAYRGDNETAYADGAYRIKEAPKEGPADYTKLMEFARFLEKAPVEGPDAAKAWKEQMDTDSVIRNMALEVLLGFSDGYIANLDNFYVYYSPKDKQIIYLPSDVDLGLGSTMVKLSDMWTGNYQQYPGFSMKRPLLNILKVPEFKTQFEQLLVKLSKELINPAIINQRIDDLANMIREDVAWDKTLPRANDNPPQPGQPGGPPNIDPSMIPPPLDVETILSMATRGSIPFETAVNGSNISIALAGVKEWFQRQTQATLAHFNAN
ncbi:hypothetical protein DFQ29_004982 [Apophysomyces sp. BC1021]|nr:hypothetical protein DFQ29_004982 [Apophysomyces sp. BC1021]